MLIKIFDVFSWDCPFIIKVINTTPKFFIEIEISNYARVVLVLFSLSQTTKATQSGQIVFESRQL